MQPADESSSAAVSRRLVYLFAVAALVVTVGFLGLFAAFLSATRATALHAAEQNARNLSIFLNDQAYRALRSAEATLDRVSDLLAARAVDPLPRGRINGLLAQNLRDAVFIRALAQADATGRIIADSSGRYESDTRSVADEDYFTAHLTGRRHLYFGRPHPGRRIGESPEIAARSRKWFLPMSVRIDNPDGSLSAVLIAAINPDVFEELYEKIDIGPRGIIRLLHYNGMLIAATATEPAEPGSSLADLPPFREFLPVHESSVYRETGADGEARIASFATTRAFPLVVTASAAERDALEGWRRDSLYIGGGAVTILVLIAAAVLLLYRQLALLRRHEAARARSETQLRAILDSVVDAIVTVDGRGTVLSFNRAAERIFGYTAAEMAGRNVCELVPDPDSQRHDSYIQRYLDSGIPHVIGLGREVMGRRHNGELFPADLSVAEMMLGGQRFFVGMVRDVTARKAAEMRLRALSAFQQAILDNADNTIIATDLDGRITLFNAAAERLLGWRAAEMVGRQTPELLHRRDEIRRRAAELSAELDEKVEPGFTVVVLKARTGAPERREWTYVRKDGSEFSVLLSVTGLRDARGELFGYLGIGTDITDTRRAQQALQEAKDRADAANRAKTEFLANMSHEIRTPMNGIIGMNSLLLDTALDPEQRQFAETVRDSAEALLDVINDILDISKLEAGQVEIEMVDFDLAELVDGAVEMVAARAHRKGIEIGALVDPGLPQRVRGDPTRLRQVLLNLLGNAIKFTERGHVSVEVSRSRSARGDLVVRFEVADTGIGIPDEVKPRLFGKFTQADSSITRRYGGTGLGLAISRQLVELMGGEIGFDSAVGRGSTFWFSARFQPAGPAGPAAKPVSPASLAGRRILVVDDSAVNRRIFTRQIEAWGTLVTAVEDGHSALAALERAVAAGAPFDLVILDQAMPEISGEQVAHRIRSTDGLRATRLILATSLGLPGRSDELRNAGFDAILTKPIQRSVLLDSVCAVLGVSPILATAEASGAAAPTDALPDAGEGLRLLVAEDNRINQLFIVTLLEKAGYSVDVAENGLEAVAAASRRIYDMILMDVQMPSLDGVEATQRIRALGGAAARVPVVAMTADALKGTRERLLASGMDDYVAKPVDRAELAAVIRRWTRAGAVPAEPAPAPPLLPPTEPGPVLDEEHLVKLERMVGRDTVEQLMAVYLPETRERLARIRDAVTRHDLAEVAREAHDLKSTSGNFGAKTLMRLATDLHRQGKAGDLAAVTVLATEVERLAAQVLDALQRRYAMSA